MNDIPSISNHKRMTKEQAVAYVDSINDLPENAWIDQVAAWKKYHTEGFDSRYQNLRDETVAAYTAKWCLDDYERDVSVGLALYSNLNPSLGFTTVLANDDDIWRYLSCVVFPDITYIRYPKPGKDDNRINTKRFYSHTRRIWVKTLWWYVHLAWQGNVDDTRKVLLTPGLGTDTISDFIERPGKGYRIALTRELMRQYSMGRVRNSHLYNRLQKQNLVNCRIIEPALTEHGERGYVTYLLKQFEEDY